MSILVGKIIGQRKIWVTTRTFVNFHSFFPDKVLILLTLTMSLFDGLDLYNLMLLKFFGIKLLFWKPINKNCKYFWFTKILFPLDSCFKSDTHKVSVILGPAFFLLWIVNIVKKTFYYRQSYQIMLKSEWWLKIIE